MTRAFTVPAVTVPVVSEEYVVLIQPSARKRSAEAGNWVNLEGSTRTFASKELAREWARACSGPDGRLWIQDAVEWDDRDIDGYLVGGDRGVRDRRNAVTVRPRSDDA